MRLLLVLKASLSCKFAARCTNETIDRLEGKTRIGSENEL